MRDLKDIRTEINETDKKITELFEKRMDLSKEVAEYKIANSLPVFDSKREEEKLKSIRSLVKNKLYEDWAVKLINDLMLYSKEYQRKLTSKKAEAPKSMVNGKVAFQGISGANSEEAAIACFGNDNTFLPSDTFEDVFKKVTDGSCDFGVVPFENSSTGTISDVFDLLLKYDLYIVGEYVLKINHRLVALEGAKLSDIKTIVSHPQALYQCSNFLNSLPDVKKEPFLNTALSAKLVKDKNDFTVAAIASPRAAEAYGLTVLKTDIADFRQNRTRFIIISKQNTPLEKADKASAIFGLSHTQGSLSSYLSNFSKYNTNLLKLESRPVKDNISKFNFFVDFESDSSYEDFEKLLARLEAEASYFKLLGKYKSNT